MPDSIVDPIPDLLMTLAAAMQTQERSRGELNEAIRTIDETRRELHRLAPQFFGLETAKLVEVAASAIPPPMPLPKTTPPPARPAGNGAAVAIIQDLAKAPQPDEPKAFERAEPAIERLTAALPPPAPPMLRLPPRNLNDPPVPGAVRVEKYAEMRGTGEANMKLAIGAGRLVAPAVYPGNWIDPEVADRQLAGAERDSPLRRAAREAIAKRKAARGPEPARLIKAADLMTRAKSPEPSPRAGA